METKSPMNHKSYGTKIRDARLAKGYSQEQLGEAIGLSQSMIYSLEKDDTRLRVDTLVKLARVLELDLREFVLGSETLGIQIHTQTNQDEAALTNISGPVTFHAQEFSEEREVWQKLDESRRETIAQMQATIDALRLAITAANLTPKV